ncbi:hypothetical protein GQ53DRAFT_858819 [Thozetella sp. PMI_491]|nr:hypothetical protein GQ53DRAFT_858819 [Thozetella sp. PMI_491]
MAVDAHTVLAAIELGFFAILLAPITWHTVSFIRDGQAGWYFLLVFVILKIAGAAMLIDINNQSQPASIGIQVTAQIFYNIALGPLLAATLSFVNNSVSKEEARATEVPRIGDVVRRRPKVGAPKSLASRLRFAHLLILVGLILGIVGGVYLAPKSNGQIDPSNRDTGVALLKVSPFLFLAAILAIAGGLVVLWDKRPALRKIVRANMTAAACALPLATIRLIYSFLSAFNLDTTTSMGHPTTFNSFTGSWVAYLFLVLIPQVVIVGIYALGGILGRQGKNHTRVEANEPGYSL